MRKKKISKMAKVKKAIVKILIKVLSKLLAKLKKKNKQKKIKSLKTNNIADNNQK